MKDKIITNQGYKCNSLVEYLPSMCETKSSTPSTAKKKKKPNKKGNPEWINLKKSSPENKKTAALGILVFFIFC